MGRLCGVATEWDFVEAPSQMLEEWAWDSDTLQRFARHHETGEPIPAELVDRMREADEFGKGTHDPAAGLLRASSRCAAQPADRRTSTSRRR